MCLGGKGPCAQSGDDAFVRGTHDPVGQFWNRGTGHRLQRLSYNLASGTREALAYDSLKKDGNEGAYNRFSSTE